MRKIKIALGDLSYYTPLTKGNLYVPLGVGYLASYVNKIYDGKVEIRIFKDPSLLLSYVESEKPDLVGLSHYYWNTELNRLVIRKVRNKLGKNVKLVLGGPSIDSDPEALLNTCMSFPEVDYFVPNEGELGFANIVGAMLSQGVALKDTILDGVAFTNEGKLFIGKDIGLSADLSTIGSPYLSGFMDEFMNDEYLPMLQTSRLCPYSCAFCVSGKNIGALRTFPMDHVKAEIDYIAKRYKEYPEHMLYIVDENFGILDRDIEVAQYIRSVSESDGYPNKLFYYNDKKFAKSSRDVHDIVGHMCFHGLMLSLQTENPEALKVIKRKNMSIEKLNDAITWGRSKEMPISTELIFGLPMETRESFLNLIDKCNEMDFDSIICYNLIIFDGIELNRTASRQQYSLKTKFRHVSSSYSHFEDDFCAEAEEIVVEAEGFDISDFRFIRTLNLLLHCTSYLRMHTLFFAYIKELDIPFSKFIAELFDMNSAQTNNKEWFDFVNELNIAIDSELFDTREELFDYMKQVSKQTVGEIPKSIKINPEFGSRMVQNSSGWVSKLLMKTLEKLLAENGRQHLLATAEFLLKIGARERVTGDNLFCNTSEETEFDVVSWKRDGFKATLESYRIPSSTIVFSPSPGLVDACKLLSVEHDDKRLQSELYKRLLQFKIDATDLLYDISILSNHKEGIIKKLS